MPTPNQLAIRFVRSSRLLERSFAFQLGTVHHAAALGIVGFGTMHGARVVPHDEVADLPWVAIAKLLAGRPLAQADDNFCALHMIYADHMMRCAADDQRFSTRAMCPHQRQFLFADCLHALQFGQARLGLVIK